MTEPTLQEKITTMTEDELNDYMHVSKVSSRVCTTVGVGSMLIALIYTSAFTVIAAGLVVYVVGQMACGVDDLKKQILECLEKKYKINS
jgi:hypothetical protein